MLMAGVVPHVVQVGGGTHQNLAVPIICQFVCGVFDRAVEAVPMNVRVTFRVAVVLSLMDQGRGVVVPIDSSPSLVGNLD